MIEISDDVSWKPLKNNESILITISVIGGIAILGLVGTLIFLYIRSIKKQEQTFSQLEMTNVFED